MPVPVIYEESKLKPLISTEHYMRASTAVSAPGTQLTMSGHKKSEIAAQIQSFPNLHNVTKNLKMLLFPH